MCAHAGAVAGAVAEAAGRVEQQQRGPDRVRALPLAPLAPEPRAGPGRPRLPDHQPQPPTRGALRPHGADTVSHVQMHLVGDVKGAPGCVNDSRIAAEQTGCIPHAHASTAALEGRFSRFAWPGCFGLPCLIDGQLGQGTGLGRALRLIVALCSCIDSAMRHVKRLGARSVTS